MLGVVVWSDKSESTAIVWCEDQGDLAFIEMHAHSSAEPHGFGAGDLIQFDLAEARHHDFRVAQNPRRIAHHYCADLRDVMATASAMGASASLHMEAQQARESGSAPIHEGANSTENVVDLNEMRQKRIRSVA